MNNAFQLVVERSNFVKSFANVQDLEKKIGAGQIEEVIIQVSMLENIFSSSPMLG
jgi:hypothetical protein